MASIAQTWVKQQEGTRAQNRVNEHKSATQRNLEYGRYVQCSEVVLQSKLLSFRAKCVYEQLLCHAREKETCYPGHTTLACELGKSVDTIQRGLRELRDLGLIRWKRRGLTKTNLYTIVELSEVPALKNFLPEKKPHTCGNQKAQECGVLKPQNCGTNQNQSKNPQGESNEESSNSLGGKDEVSAPACSQVEQGTTRKTDEETKKEQRFSPPSSNVTPDTSLKGSHSPPTRAGISNLDSPPQRETGRPRQSLSVNDEVIGKRERVKPEPPRMSAPPLTQEDMDQRIRERLARERARTHMQNPLPGIIRDEDWQKLERDTPTQQPPLRCKPMPCYPQLQAAIEEISEKLGDFHHAKSNITHTDNIRREAGVSLEQVLGVLEEAYQATRVAAQKGSITKRDEQGRLVKMSYFFAVVRQKLGLPPKPGQTV